MPAPIGQLYTLREFEARGMLWGHLSREVSTTASDQNVLTTLAQFLAVVPDNGLLWLTQILATSRPDETTSHQELWVWMADAAGDRRTLLLNPLNPNVGSAGVPQAASMDGSIVLDLGRGQGLRAEAIYDIGFADNTLTLGWSGTWTPAGNAQSL